MQVTEVQIHLIHEERLKAFASVTFDHCFVVHNVKVVDNGTRLIVCMPSRKTAINEYRDLVHPVSQLFRSYLEERVLKEYRTKLAVAQTKMVGQHAC